MPTATFQMFEFFSFPCGQTYNEVQRCFLTVGLVYPEDLFVFLLNVSILSSNVPSYCHMIQSKKEKLSFCSTIVYKVQLKLDDLFFFLHLCYQKCKLKEELLVFGALCVLKHLLPRFFTFCCLYLLCLILLHNLTFLQFYMEAV